MFITGSDLTKARIVAQKNANWGKEPWVIFTDTSGNLRGERQSVGPKDVDVTVVYPETVFFVADGGGRVQHLCTRSCLPFCGTSAASGGWAYDVNTPYDLDTCSRDGICKNCLKFARKRLRELLPNPPR